jgi:hypothetical protein
MQANGLTTDSSQKQKDTVCNECRRSESAFQKAAQYSTLWIDDYVTTATRTEIESEVAAVTKENWQSTVGNEIPVYRYSTYLSMLHHKVPNVTATEQSWQEYVSDLGSSLIALSALPDIYEQVNPTHCFVYNPLYPTNRVFTELALQRSNVQYVGVSAASYVADRYSTIALFRSIQSSQTAVDSPNLTESMDIPLSSLEVELVARHIGHLIQGRDPWVYSSPPTRMPVGVIHERLGTDGNKPVAVVLIGSPDETRSSALVDAEFERVPINQLSQVTEFIESSLVAARNLPHIDFVFRLHPRLAPNKRESFRSPDMDLIEKLLNRRSPNVFINQPEDGIGLYDVARIATIGINHASSAGLEFLALGIPVVHYDPPRLNAYPPTLGDVVGRSSEEQFTKVILQAIEKPRSINVAINAWRWYAVTLVRAITHRSWEERPQTQDPTPREEKLTWLRNLLPESFRERVSRSLAARAQEKKIDRPGSSGETPAWVMECIERISRFDNSAIWNPIAFTRGESLSSEFEKSEIEKKIHGINELIGAPESSI